MKGRVIGQYRVTGVLGEGGMGIVYAAQHTLLDRPAAVKVLLPGLSGKQDIVKRFFDEARAATRIRHPGIVEVYDFGWTQDGAAFIVMEHLEGETLRARRQRRHGRLRWNLALAFARQIAGALAAAHIKGIVHRDLKPDNIFLVPDSEVPGGERIKLLDFGIAKLAGPSSSQHKTRTGAVMGTPTYMAPEQCRGIAVDARADLYALGCILFELCAGQPPFVGEGEGDVLIAHVKTPPPSLSSLVSGIPTEVESLVQRLLEKAPANRVQTADELIRLIDTARSAIGRVARRGSHTDIITPASIADRESEPEIWTSTDPLPAGGAGGPPSLPEVSKSPPARRSTRGAVSLDGDEGGTIYRAPVTSISLELDTTLSSAAGTHPRAERNGSVRQRVAARVIAGGLAVVGGLALVLNLLQGEGERPIETAVSRSTANTGSSSSTISPAVGATAPSLPSAVAIAPSMVTSLTTQQKPSVAPDRLRPESSQAPSTPAKPSPRQATEVTLSIQSQPSGATVSSGNVFFGVTPLDVNIKAGASDLIFEIRLDGYQTSEFVVKPTNSLRKLIRLRQSPRSRPSRPASYSQSLIPPRLTPRVTPTVSPPPQPAPSAGSPPVESTPLPAAPSEPPPAATLAPSPPVSPEHRGINPF